MSGFYLKFLSINSIICISGSVSFDCFFPLVIGHIFLFPYIASDFFHCMLEIVDFTLLYVVYLSSFEDC